MTIKLPDKELFEPEDVAKLMGVTRQTVLMWVRGGRLPGTKYTRKLIRIPRESLKRFVEMDGLVMGLGGDMPIKEE